MLDLVFSRDPQLELNVRVLENLDNTDRNKLIGLIDQNDRPQR